MVQTLPETRTAEQEWRIDTAHATVEFAVKHLMISTVRGRFGHFDAVIRGDPKDPLSARAEATIDVASLDTGVADRDTHLRSADFFDVEQFPALRYVSKDVRKRDDDRFEVEGELTIRDITRPVTLVATLEGSVKDPVGNDRIGVSAEGKIKRSDFGLTWNMALEAGGVVVGEDVHITVHAEVVHQTA